MLLTGRTTEAAVGRTVGEEAGIAGELGATFAGTTTDAAAGRAGAAAVFVFPFAPTVAHTPELEDTGGLTPYKAVIMQLS